MIYLSIYRVGQNNSASDFFLVEDIFKTYSISKLIERRKYSISAIFIISLKDFLYPIRHRHVASLYLSKNSFIFKKNLLNYFFKVLKAINFISSIKELVFYYSLDIFNWAEIGTLG
jgi:hypothetical protein